MKHQFKHGGDAALVQTRQGKVQGYICDGISIFKGIPYAQARRFHMPQPVKPWEGVLDATSYGYVCPLLEIGKPNGELAVPHRYWPMSEHCQNLNVWTPACDEEKRPVLVWLHGGGYEAGSAIEQVAYEGENMCREGQVVVVSINHRLNILGYFDVSDFGEEYANSGNAGGEDIVMALRWVHENIEQFGGDPGNVTVFGQSGGGGKVTTLLQTPSADGLYAKGINMSGVLLGILDDAKGSGKELAEAIMKELGLSGIRELEEVSYDQFAAAYKKLKPAFVKAGKYVGCSPQPNAYYAGDPVENGFRKETADIPLLVGTVFGEFGGFDAPARDPDASFEDDKASVVETLGEKAAEELIPLFQKAYPDRRISDLLTLDFMFRLPAIEYIKVRSGLNAATYAYLFNLDLPMNGGSCPWHCADIPYVFHNTELVPVTWEEGVTEKIEDQIFSSVMAFARTGNPNNETIPEWPASAPDAQKTMIFARETQLSVNHDRELIPLYAKYMGPIFMKKMQQMRNEDAIQH